AAPALAPQADAAGEFAPGRVAGLRPGVEPIAPLHAEPASEVLRGLDDVCFDQDLRALRVELLDQLARVLEAVRDVAHDDRVRPVVEGDAAGVAEHALHLVDERSVRAAAVALVL